MFLQQHILIRLIMESYFAIYNFVYYAEQELRISSFYACYGRSLNLKFGPDQGQEQET